MTKKQIYKQMQPDGTWIDFREAKAAFAPKKAEFEKLLGKITKTIGKQTTPEFDDKIDYLITLLREQAYMASYRPPVTKSQKELTALSTHLKKLILFLDADFSQHADRQLMYQTVIKMSDEKIEDPFYALRTNAIIALDICEKAREKLKGKRPDFTPNTMRQILAEEVARELMKLGVEPKKYNDGDYAKVLRAILKMIPCTVHGQKISIAIPDNLFKVICKAIDEYPTKPPYSLLSFQ